MSEEQDRPEPEVVDAVVVEVDEAPAADVSKAVAMVPTVATEVMRPFAVEEIKAAMNEYQRAIVELLDDSDWQGTPGKKGSFVKKSGWRKVAKGFGLSVQRVESGVERDPEGNPIRAFSVYRATAPNGQSQDADGYCSADEPRFADAKGRQKLENDMRATATTRAKNRAISDLVGMGEVSAEEIDVAGNTDGPAGEPEPYDRNLTPAWNQIAGVIGTDPAVKLSDFILKDNGGYIPMKVGRVLVAVGRLLEQTVAKQEQDTAAEAPDLPVEEESEYTPEELAAQEAAAADDFPPQTTDVPPTKGEQAAGKNPEDVPF